MANNVFTLLGVTPNTDNYGVRVLLTAALENLLVSQGTRVCLLDYGREPLTWNEQTIRGVQSVSLINLRFSWKLHLPNNIFRLLGVVAASRILPSSTRERLWKKNPWLNEILSANCHFSLAGGDSFSDIYGVRRYLYVTLPQILVLLMKGQLVQLPQTYGPYKSGFARTIARFIIRRSRAVFSRDAEGVKTIQSLFPDNPPRVTVSPDLGLGMFPAELPSSVANEVQGCRRRGPVIGVNISSLLYMGGYTGRNMFGLREDFREFSLRLLEYLTSNLKLEVVLIPHVCGGPGSQEDETRLCRQLATDFSSREGKVHFFDQSLDHRQMKTLIGYCDLFIGARMHACIAAVSQGTPAVCLAYSGKFAGVMAPLGRGACVMDLRHATNADVLNAVSGTLKQLPELRLELKANMKAVHERLRMACAQFIPSQVKTSESCRNISSFA